jgi:hypothetical protein
VRSEGLSSSSRGIGVGNTMLKASWSSRKDKLPR